MDIQELAAIPAHDAYFHAKCAEAGYFYHQGQFYKHIVNVVDNRAFSYELSAGKEYMVVGNYILVKPDMVYFVNGDAPPEITAIIKIKDNYSLTALYYFQSYLFHGGVHYYVDTRDGKEFLNWTCSVRDLIVSDTISPKSLLTIAEKKMPGIYKLRECYSGVKSYL